MVVISLAVVGLVGVLVFGVGIWVTRPAPVVWRWLARGVLAGVLVALLTPAGVVDAIQDWVKGWLPIAASASSAPGADWVIHFLSFAGLGALLFHVRRDIPPAWLGAGLVVLGGLTEVLQMFVEGRSAAVGDLVADGIGVVVGYVVALGLGRGRRMVDG